MKFHRPLIGFGLLFFSLFFCGCLMNNTTNQATDELPASGSTWLHWETKSGLENPWEIWSKTIQWAETPGEPDKITGYYSDKWNKANPYNTGPFALKEYRRVKTEEMTDVPPIPNDPDGSKMAQWQERYGRGLIIEVQVDNQFVNLLTTDGWIRISAPSAIEE